MLNLKYKLFCWHLSILADASFTDAAVLQLTPHFLVWRVLIWHSYFFLTPLCLYVFASPCSAPTDSSCSVSLIQRHQLRDVSWRNWTLSAQGQPTTCSVQFVNHSTYVKNYFCAGCKVLEIFTRSAEKVIEISKSVS